MGNSRKVEGRQVPGGSPEFVPHPLWEAGIHGSALPFCLQNKGRLEARSPVGLHCCFEERAQECFGKGVRELECGEEVGSRVSVRPEGE